MKTQSSGRVVKALIFGSGGRRIESRSAVLGEVHNPAVGTRTIPRVFGYGERWHLILMSVSNKHKMEPRDYKKAGNKYTERHLPVQQEVNSEQQVIRCPKRAESGLMPKGGGTRTNTDGEGACRQGREQCRGGNRDDSTTPRQRQRRQSALWSVINTGRSPTRRFDGCLPPTTDLRGIRCTQ